MTNKILVVILILIVLYLVYQQNQPNLNNSSSQAQDLQQQVQHYQTLYQKRVEKDLEVDQSRKIEELTERYTKLSEKNNELSQVNSLYQQKVEDQDKALISLARQKLKGKKVAESLLNKLEGNWKQDQELWKVTETDYLKKLDQAKKDREQKDQNLKTYLSEQRENVGELEKFIN